MNTNISRNYDNIFVQYVIIIILNEIWNKNTLPFMFSDFLNIKRRII